MRQTVKEERRRRMIRSEIIPKDDTKRDYPGGSKDTYPEGSKNTYPGRLKDTYPGRSNGAHPGGPKDGT